MRIHFFGVILLGSVLLMSCESNRVVTIDSQPQGASVIADGREIGKTPLEIVADEEFPPRWIGGNYMVKGNLQLKKPECESVSIKVNDSVLSNDISQKLTCSDKVDTQANTPANPVNDTITQRLEKLNELQKKGLVTDEEYKTQKLRILNEL